MNYIKSKFRAISDSWRFLKLLPAALLTSSLAVANSDQAAHNSMLVIDSEGGVQLLEIGDQGAPAPIILLNGRVLHQGGVGCKENPDHPQCLTFSGLTETSKQPNAPGVLIVTKGQGAELLLNLQSSDYPPPVVIVDGEVVNR